MHVRKIPIYPPTCDSFLGFTVAHSIDALDVIIFWIFNAFFFTKFTQVSFPILTPVLTLDATHNCVSFQCDGASTKSFTPQKLFGFELLETKKKQLLERIISQTIRDNIYQCVNRSFPVKLMSRNSRRHRLSRHRHAIPRWLLNPSKFPTKIIWKITPGVQPGLP